MNENGTDDAARFHEDLQRSLIGEMASSSNSRFQESQQDPIDKALELLLSQTSNDESKEDDVNMSGYIPTEEIDEDIGYIGPANRSLESDQSTTAKLFVSNVPSEVSHNDLQEFFSQFGTVIRCLRSQGPSTSMRNSWLIVFDTVEAQTLALSSKNLVLGGGVLTAKRASLDTPIKQLSIGRFETKFKFVCHARFFDPSDGELVKLQIDKEREQVAFTVIEKGTPYRLEFHFAILSKHFLVDRFDSDFSLYLQTRRPPRIFRQMAPTEKAPGTWIRTTGFQAPLLGYCSVYKVTFSRKDSVMIADFLKDIAPLKSSNTSIKHSFWKPPFGRKEPNQFPLPNILRDGLNMRIHPDIIYKICALACDGSIDPYNEFAIQNLLDEILRYLDLRSSHVAEHRKVRAVLRVLEMMIDSHVRFWNPDITFKNRLKDLPEFSNPEDPENTMPYPPPFPNHVLVRRIVVTPTKFYCEGPSFEPSNRVLRRFASDYFRFARVIFRDEDRSNLSSISNRVSDEIFENINRILTNGISVAGFKYKFLSFSASQLRSHSVWCFAEDTQNNVGHSPDSIRKWMGNFDSIPSPYRYAARMGQCFSSTIASGLVDTWEFKEIADIERNGYCFSDGNGSISPSFLETVCQYQKFAAQPSLIQFRFRGYKGTVLLDPNMPSFLKLKLRKSMNKFESTHQDFEIVATSQRHCAYLNIQLITLLDCLKIDRPAILDLQAHVINILRRMDTDQDAARYAVTKMQSASPFQYSIFSAVRDMLQADFSIKDEPFLRAVLQVIRAEAVNELRDKARIFVEDGVALMGALDIQEILEPGEVYVNFVDPETNKLTTIQGPVMITRFPCLHPGDVRVATAVKHPGLAHLKSCLIFSSKGQRPLFNECAGGDLDGDLYTVIWNRKLIPKEPYLALDETKPKVTSSTSKKVQMSDIIRSFTNYIQNDNISRIATAHVAIADLSPVGALDERCLFLAKQHSIAVDFSKTGLPADFPSDCEPPSYPTFQGIRRAATHTSNKTLGLLYMEALKLHDELTAQGVFKIKQTKKPQYDQSLEVPGFATHGRQAIALRNEYEAKLKQIMDDWGIGTEQEAITGMVIEWEKRTTLQRERRQHYDLKQRIIEATSQLRTEFRQKFFDPRPAPPPGSHTSFSKQDRQRASAWYWSTYSPDARRDCPEGHFHSFAWIVADILCDIKRNPPTTPATATSATSSASQ